MFRKITFIFFFFFSSSVFADTYPTVEWWALNQFPELGKFASGQAACSAKNQYYFLVGGYHTCRLANSSTSDSGYLMAHSFYCPAGGELSGSNCINAPACTAPQVRNTTTGMCQTPPVCSAGTSYDNPSNSCPGVSVCTGSQTPTTSPCKYPADKGIGINCADGKTVYVPQTCAVTGSRWQDVFPPPKPMCSPLQTDHTNCTPSIFQRMDDFASSHAIQYATAVLSLLSLPVIAAETAVVVSGVAVDAKAIWDGVFHNSAGEIVDVKVAGEVPKSVMGDAVSDFIKNNPTDPYSTNFPRLYNEAAPQAPIVVEPNTGVIHPVDSTVPLSSNQIMDAARQISSGLSIPYSQLAPYITPERIPWIVEAQSPINYDIQHQQAPVNYPELVRTTNPLQSSSPYYQISPNPLETAPLFPASTPQSVTGIIPFTVFSPSSPLPLTPPVPTTTQPPAQYNPNPAGTDAPTSPSIPPPTTPIDPNQVEVPPVPPTIYPDTWKYFDFLPMENPFHFDISNLLPTLPQTSCYYEVHTSFHVPFLGVKHVDFAPCLPLQPLRAVLDWVFGVITMWVCFLVVFRSSI